MKNIGTFLSQVKAELLKIEWPSWEEFIGSTIITLLLVLFFSIYLFGVDQVIKLGMLKVFALGS